MISATLVADIRRVFEAFSNPFFLLFCVLVLLLLHIICKKGRPVVRTTALLAILSLGIISTPWLPRYLTDYLERQYTSVVQVDPNIHWVVVLGGGVYPSADLSTNETLGMVSIKRLLEGVRLYRELPLAKLILSGGGEKNNRESVGARMGELASWFNIPAEHRLVENDSINTADEAMRIKEMLRTSPFYLVTSAIHMPRSMRLFKHQGLHPVAAPCHYTYYWKNEPRIVSYIPNIANVEYTMIAWHEILGMAWGKIRDIL